LLCIKEDTYFECTSEWVKAKQGWVRFFTNNVGRYLCIIYDDMKIEESITAIKLLMGSELPGDKIKVYVFSNGQYPYTEDFEEVLDNITLSALPDAIYKAYQNVLPKKNKLLVPELEEPSAEELESEIND